MFRLRKSEDHSVIDEMISDLLVHLNDHPRHSTEYSNIADQIIKLRTLQNNTSDRVSPDTMATIIANLAGILVIIHHEKAGVVASKALAFLTKIR